MRAALIAGALGLAALIGAAPAQAQPDLHWACARLAAQPTLSTVSNVVAKLSMTTTMSGDQIANALLTSCPRERFIVADYFGVN